MTASPSARSLGASLESLRRRDDLLQGLYWLRGEGFAVEADLALLATILATAASDLREPLERLGADGLVETIDGRYRLTDAGAREGGRRFADEFADLQRGTHGLCPPDCPECRGVHDDDCEHCARLGVG